MQVPPAVAAQVGLWRAWSWTAKANDEYPMSLDEFLNRIEYLADAVEAVDEEARKSL